MRYYLLVIALLFVLSGCSSPSSNTDPTTREANSATENTNPANANTLAATNSSPPGEMVPYKGVENLNPSAFNATNDNLKVIPNQPKDDQFTSGRRTAPDDSIVVSSSRGKDFLETRTFQNHETLARVEKIMDGKNTKYKVYLKNGRVYDAPADKMNNFTAMAPANILSVIGLQPKQPIEAEVKKEEKPQ